MIYYKIDLTHPKAALALKALESGFKLVRERNNLSVTRNLAGTQAWVKLINDVDLSSFAGIILDKAVLSLEHQQKVQSDIYSPEWASTEE